MLYSDGLLKMTKCQKWPGCDQEKTLIPYYVCDFDQSEVNNKLQVLKVLQRATLEYQIFWQPLKQRLNSVLRRSTNVLYITYHVFLRRLYRSEDSIRAAVGQVLAHPLLHVRQQLLTTTTTTGVRGHTESNEKNRGTRCVTLASSLRALSWQDCLVITKAPQIVALEGFALESFDNEEIICASTYRFVDLEDVVWGVEVRVELIDDDVEAADLLFHGAGYLDKTQPEFSVSYSTARQE